MSRDFYHQVICKLLLLNPASHFLLENSLEQVQKPFYQEKCFFLVNYSQTMSLLCKSEGGTGNVQHVSKLSVQQSSDDDHIIHGCLSFKYINHDLTNVYAMNPFSPLWFKFMHKYLIAYLQRKASRTATAVRERESSWIERRQLETN